MPIKAGIPLSARCAFDVTFVNRNIAAINSPIKMPIPPSADPILSESMPDNTHNEAARIPIAIAMFLIVPDCKFCCQLFNESSTEPRMSFILSTTLNGPSNDSVIPVTYFLMPYNIVVNKLPLRISKRDLMSPF